MLCVNWMTQSSALTRVKLHTSEFILRGALAMATHGPGLGPGAVILHTKAGALHTTSLLSGLTEEDRGKFLSLSLFFLDVLSCFVLRIYIPD